jgi:hypothetical protein
MALLDRSRAVAGPASVFHNHPKRVPADSLLQVFRDDPKITIAQDGSGALRISIGSVSIGLFETRTISRALNAKPEDARRNVHSA